MVSQDLFFKENFRLNNLGHSIQPVDLAENDRIAPESSEFHIKTDWIRPKQGHNSMSKAEDGRSALRPPNISKFQKQGTFVEIHTCLINSNQRHHISLVILIFLIVQLIEVLD